MAERSKDKLDNLEAPQSFEEQLAKLRGRKLLVGDESAALGVLERVNYYRLSGYMLSLQKRDRFIAGASFETVYNLYEFDKQLRKLLIGVLETIEVAFRTHVAYLIAHQYGPLGHENSENFINASYHQDFISELKRELEQRKDEWFMGQHQDQDGGHLPVWVAVEVLSFGSLSKMYSNLKNEDKKKIASDYYGLPYSYFSSWLKTLAHVKNICAHYGRLYNRSLSSSPKLDSKDKKLELQADKIFVVVLIMKKLCLDGREWRTLVSTLAALVEQYSEVVDLELIGFPTEWETLLTR